MSKIECNLILAFILIEMALFGVGVALSDSGKEQKEALTIQSITDINQNKRIEALEKEIRILKTDIQLMQCGFEESSNE